MSLKSAIKEVLSEPGQDGTLSWGRVASTIALMFGIGWISRLVYLNHALPALDGVTAFMLGPYAANKAATAAQSFSPSAPPQSPFGVNKG